MRGTRLLLALVVIMLVAAPAAAQCVEAPAGDVWTCAADDPDGFDATTNGITDTVTVDPGVTVSATSSLSVITVNIINGTVNNSGAVQNGEVAGAAIFAFGSVTTQGSGTFSAIADSGVAVASSSGTLTNAGNVAANVPSGSAMFQTADDIVNDGMAAANGDFGTALLGGSGDNTITNNATASATGPDGIAIATGTGNDTVILGGASTTTGGSSTESSICAAGIVLAICTGDNDDIVRIANGATVTGVIDGAAGADTLDFGFLTPSQAALLNPAGGNLTNAGKLYEWINFETIEGSSPVISINDVTLAEGTGAVTNFDFTLTLSEPVNAEVTVTFTADDNTATSADDFVPVSATATFPMNVTTTTATVTVTADNKFEGTEMFFVNLSSPSANAAIDDDQGIGTITNDDPQPTLMINDVTAAETNAGTTTFTFIVGISNPSATAVTVDAATQNDTAAAPADFIAFAPTPVTFPANSAAPRPVSVTVNGDTAFESDETFFVNLTSPAGATIADNQGLGTITNDDGRTADFSITKSGPALAVTGTPFNYTITATNNGPDDATGATVTDTLPANVTLVSATPSQGSCSGTTTVTCNLGAILNGASVTITLSVNPAAPDPATSNTAAVAGADADPNVANDTSAPATTNVLASGAIPTLSTMMLLVLVLALAGLAALRLR
jgi:uncharacterized repeat protein (TIGR01451 family)